MAGHVVGRWLKSGWIYYNTPGLLETSPGCSRHWEQFFVGARWRTSAVTVLGTDFPGFQLSMTEPQPETRLLWHMFMFTKRTLSEIPLRFAKTSKYQSLPREASGPLWRNWRRDKSWGILVLGTGVTSITTYLAFNHLQSSSQETPAGPSSAWNSEPSEVKKGQAESWGTAGEKEATGWSQNQILLYP